jgi:hypothetical protein
MFNTDTKQLVEVLYSFILPIYAYYKVILSVINCLKGEDNLYSV